MLPNLDSPKKVSSIFYKGSIAQGQLRNVKDRGLIRAFCDWASENDRHRSSNTSKAAPNVDTPVSKKSPLKGGWYCYTRL